MFLQTFGHFLNRTSFYVNLRALYDVSVSRRPCLFREMERCRNHSVSSLIFVSTASSFDITVRQAVSYIVEAPVTVGRESVKCMELYEMRQLTNLGTPSSLRARVVKS